MVSVTIGIVTYNRKSILEKMAKSLYLSDLTSANVNIRVYDDCSTDFDKKYLESIFPNAFIHINKENLKADLNTFSMYQDFLKSNDDYFFNADSDLIFRKDWLTFCLNNIEKTDGVLSIFNTKNHKTIIDSNLPDFVLKADIGAAGTFFKREKIQSIVTSLSLGKQKKIDWAFSQLFLNNNISIYCSKESYVQHIGLIGQNSSLVAIDYADNFKVDSIENGQIINDITNSFLTDVTVSVQKSLMHSKFYKFGYYVLFPVVLLKKIRNSKNIKKTLKNAKTTK